MYRQLRDWGKVNSLMKSFLTNRTQVVVIEGEQSIYVPVKSGVPRKGQY